jgi:hypothetical protein
MLTVIEVEINGAKFPVRYDVNAWVEYENIVSKSFTSIFEPMNITNSRALAYVGLKCGHSYHFNKITQFNKSIEEVGEFVPTNKLKEFLPIASQFIVGEKSEQKPVQEGEAKEGE